MKNVKVHKLHFAGYDFEASPNGTVVRRDIVGLTRNGDHGCDPLPDGRFRMVPSGDVVSAEEKERRLGRD